MLSASGTWYDDDAMFFNYRSSSRWLYCGTNFHDSSFGGEFTFVCTTGDTLSYNSSRSILS